jgi:hypothetical protein
MCRLTLLFQAGSQRQCYNIRAIAIPGIILENQTRTPAALFTAASTETHEVYIADSREFLCVVHGAASFPDSSVSITPRREEVKLN